MSKVRLRFAPSPTGYLHIGGVRTALYSWLYTRQQGGEFILRIEDTDRERSTEESVRIVLESMHWLELDYDEGPDKPGPHAPYFQAQRLDLYREYAEKLVASGHAYRCYATKEEIAAAREAHAATGTKVGFRFQSPYRDGSRQPPSPDAGFVYRFRVPSEGATGWDDLVKGRIDVPNDTQQDFILLRGDGMPLYNFGCVIDDLTMGITHVCRGDDHVVNTPLQILLYRALGKEHPVFAHLPMVLAPNGEKLSKRHAAVGVLEYRDMGYLPDSVLNYLVRLGWSHGDQEIFSRQELVEKCNWESVGSTAGKYDGKKFAFVQTEQFRRAIEQDAARIARGVVPFLAKRGVVITDEHPLLVPAIRALRARVNTFADLAEWIDYFFVEPVPDDATRAKSMPASSADTLEALANVFEQLPAFDAASLDGAFKAWLETSGLKIKEVAPAVRVALTGRANGALFEVMEVLGREASVARLRKGAALART